MKLTFMNGYAEGFTMAVPECFRAALEKERFDRGDTFYDTKLAYNGTWADGITHLSYCLQVVDFVGGYVEFMVLQPKGKPAKLECVSRAREPVANFIYYLKNGYKSDS